MSAVTVAECPLKGLNHGVVHVNKAPTRGYLAASPQALYDRG